MSRRRRIWPTTSPTQRGSYRAIQYNDFNVAGSFTGGVEAVTKMRELAQGPEEWVVIVDLDEFVEFPEPVTDLVERSRPRAQISLAASCTIDLPSTVSLRLLTTIPTFPRFSRSGPVSERW